MSDKERDDWIEGEHWSHDGSGDYMRAAWEACREHEVKPLVETIKLLGDHHADCECWCMDHRGIANEALEKHDTTD